MLSAANGHFFPARVGCDFTGQHLPNGSETFYCRFISAALLKILLKDVLITLIHATGIFFLYFFDVIKVVLVNVAKA